MHSVPSAAHGGCDGCSDPPQSTSAVLVQGAGAGPTGAPRRAAADGCAAGWFDRFAGVVGSHRQTLGADPPSGSPAARSASWRRCFAAGHLFGRRRRGLCSWMYLPLPPTPRKLPQKMIEKPTKGTLRATMAHKYLKNAPLVLKSDPSLPPDRHLELPLGS